MYNEYEKHSSFLLWFCFLLIKGLVMKPLTNMPQTMVYRIAHLESSSVTPLLLFSHQAWMHKDATAYFGTLIFNF